MMRYPTTTCSKKYHDANEARLAYVKCFEGRVSPEDLYAMREATGDLLDCTPEEDLETLQNFWAESSEWLPNIHPQLLEGIAEVTRLELRRERLGLPYSA